MSKYIYELSEWPKFKWHDNQIVELLAHVRYKQAFLIGKMSAMGFTFREEAKLQTLTTEIIKSSEIEGENLDQNLVRSSIARHLGMDVGGLAQDDRHVDGIVQMLLDATQNYNKPLTSERLFGWHSLLFPTGYSGMYKILAGGWRDDSKGRMEVVDRVYGKERVCYVAPLADSVQNEMEMFLNWFNGPNDTDSVLRAAIAHLWFVTIHPFDDGNGRIARAITDMMLARSEESQHRFYSMSAQIRLERNSYYDILGETQKGSLDITPWLKWFLNCLDRALDGTKNILRVVLHKSDFWKFHEKETFNDRQRSMLNKLLDGFEGKLTSSKWAKITKSSSDTALRDINDLVARNILVKEDSGGRSTSYNLKYSSTDTD